MTNTFPVPNTRLNGSVVVASCYYRELTEDDRKHVATRDDWPNVVYLVLLLNEKAPYFTVAHIADNGLGSYKILNSEDRLNIVKAVNDLYVSWGGDI